ADITDPDALLDCLRYLHDCGSIVFFDEEELREHVVLNPQWLADAMAHILNCPRVVQGSVAAAKRLRERGELEETSCLPNGFGGTTSSGSTRRCSCACCTVSTCWCRGTGSTWCPVCCPAPITPLCPRGPTRFGPPCSSTSTVFFVAYC
ncbi:unnamed protein product, partial [Effrenium voratum]